MFTQLRPAKPGPMLPDLLRHVPLEVLNQFTMSTGQGEGGAGGAGQGQGEGGDGKGGEPKTFTQAQLDQVIADRLARERAKFAGHDDLVKAKEELDRLKAEGQSEQEKAIAKARKEAGDEARSQERTKAETLILKAKVEAAAGVKFADPADAVTLLDLSGLTVGENGEVDKAAIDKRLDDLLEKKPYLKAGAAGNGNGGAGGGLGNLGQGQRQQAGQVARGDRGRAEAERRYGKKSENSST